MHLMTGLVASAMTPFVKHSKLQVAPRAAIPARRLHGAAPIAAYYRTVAGGAALAARVRGAYLMGHSHLYTVAKVAFAFLKKLMLRFKPCPEPCGPWLRFVRRQP